jgi:hypothetical protein
MNTSKIKATMNVAPRARIRNTSIMATIISPPSSAYPNKAKCPSSYRFAFSSNNTAKPVQKPYLLQRHLIPLTLLLSRFISSFPCPNMGYCTSGNAGHLPGAAATCVRNVGILTQVVSLCSFIFEPSITDRANPCWYPFQSSVPCDWQNIFPTPCAKKFLGVLFLHFQPPILYVV